MNKYKIIVAILAVVFVVSGCTVNADSNQNVTYPVYNESADDSDSVPPYGYELETVVESLEPTQTEIKHDYETVTGGASYIYNQIQEGSQGYRSVQYLKMYNDDGELLSKVEVIDSEEVVPTTNTVVANGQEATSGAYFETNRITRYGVDCNGCNMGSDGRGGTASGISVGLDEVRQQDGTWQKGITYQGYYIVAASSDIPLCSILEISEHSISGGGISAGEPFYAIVLDRGGGVQESHIDLFAGSESNPLTGHMPKGYAKVSIISNAARYQSGGLWNCDV